MLAFACTPQAASCHRSDAANRVPRPVTVTFNRAAAPARRAALPQHRRQLTAAATQQATATTTSFDDMLAESKLPVLVDFYAPWCGPCRVVAMAIQKLEPTMKEEVLFVKLDVEQQPAVAQRYNIKALPTMLLFAAGGGEPLDRFEGAMTAQDLQLWIKSKLSSSK